MLEQFELLGVKGLRVPTCKKRTCPMFEGQYWPGKLKDLARLEQWSDLCAHASLAACWWRNERCSGTAKRLGETQKDKWFHVFQISLKKYNDNERRSP